MTVAELAATALDWITVDARARLILNDALGVCWRNAAADSALTCARGMWIERERLAFRRPADERAVRALVTSLGSGRETLVLPFDDESGHFLLRAWTGSGVGGAAVCMEVALDDATVPIAYSDIETAFGLTGGEARIVHAMLSGMTVAAVAADRGLSVDTVRSHIRHIYAKLDVDSREQLFRRLSPFRIA